MYVGGREIGLEKPDNGIKKYKWKRKQTYLGEANDARHLAAVRVLKRKRENILTIIVFNITKNTEVS